MMLQIEFNFFLLPSPNSCLLLDVGENTSGQIHRFYGPNAEEVFRKLKAIYVSHLHADHHMVWK